MERRVPPQASRWGWLALGSCLVASAVQVPMGLNAGDQVDPPAFIAAPTREAPPDTPSSGPTAGVRSVPPAAPGPEGGPVAVSDQPLAAGAGGGVERLVAEALEPRTTGCGSIAGSKLSLVLRPVGRHGYGVGGAVPRDHARCNSADNSSAAWHPATDGLYPVGAGASEPPPTSEPPTSSPHHHRRASADV